MRLHREAYGKGARLAKVLADENTVVVIMDDLELLPNEEFLISEGHEVTVLETRPASSRRSGPSSARPWSAPPAAVSSGSTARPTSIPTTSSRSSGSATRRTSQTTSASGS